MLTTTMTYLNLSAVLDQCFADHPDGDALKAVMAERIAAELRLHGVLLSEYAHTILVEVDRVVNAIRCVDLPDARKLRGMVTTAAKKFVTPLVSVDL
jgi:hypothetical protein